MYEITFARSARKELQSIPVNVAERILAKIEDLSTNPRPPGCKKLKGSNLLWRLRVGDYRVVYSIDDTHQIVDIAIVRHRSDAYR